MPVNIKKQVFIPAAVAGVLILLALNLFWLPSQLETVKSRIAQDARLQLRNFAIVLRTANEGFSVATLTAQFEELLAANPSWKSIQLVESDTGRRIFPPAPVVAADPGQTISVSAPLVTKGESSLSLKLVVDPEPGLQPTHNFSLVANLAVLLLLVFGIVGNYLLQNKLVWQPLQRLSEAAKKWANGEFETAIPRDARHEVQELAFNLATMTNSLRLAVDSAEEEAAIAGKALDVLQASEDRFARAVSGSNDGIWDWDIESGRIYLSPHWKGMLGFADNELENSFLNWRDLVHDDDLGHFLLTWTDYLEGVTPSFELEYRIRCKDESFKWVLCRGASTRDENGIPIRMSGSQTDITERKKAETSLRLQAAALEAAADAIVVTDRHGYIQWLNPALASLTKHSIEELKGQHTRIWKSDKQDDEFYSHLWATITSGKHWHGELYNKRKDGSLYLEDQTITPVRGSNDEISHFIAIKRDITEARRVQNDLSRFKTTLDQTSDCVFIFDPVELLFTYVNDGACKQVGYSRSELMNMTPVDLTSSNDTEQFRDMLSPLIEGFERSVTYETDYRSKDGTISPVEVALQYVAPKGEAPRFVAFVRDISERLHMQQQLQQAQKMQAVGQLTGGIAHDFNNMLASIMGYNELALERAEGIGDQNLIRYLGEVFQASKRARDLIAQMLAFSRGSGGEPPEPVQMTSLVNEVLSMLRPIIPKTIDVKVHLEAESPVVMVNVINFQQIVMNLALNAADAMNGKGRLDITVQHQDLLSETCSACHEKVRGDYVGLCFVDSGPGIPSGVMEHLFEPFFSTKEVGKGTGMGLAVVHGIMHELGGHVVVRNNPSGGASFHLLFPTVDLEQLDMASAQTDVLTLEADVENESEIASPAITRMKPRILIVDDEESVARFLAELLQRAGYMVSVDSNSQRALLGFTRHPSDYDLVITDFSMPVMSGVEMSEAMHVVRPDLPVILCSGYTDAVDRDNAQNLGITEFLQKPVQTDVLLTQVANLLETRSGTGIKKHA